MFFSFFSSKCGSQKPAMIIRKPGVQFCVATVVFLSFAVFHSGEIQNIFVLLYLFDYKLLEVVPYLSQVLMKIFNQV